MALMLSKLFDDLNAIELSMASESVDVNTTTEVQTAVETTEFIDNESKLLVDAGTDIYIAAQKVYCNTCAISHTCYLLRFR